MFVYELVERAGFCCLRCCVESLESLHYVAKVLKIRYCYWLVRLLLDKIMLNWSRTR